MQTAEPLRIGICGIGRAGWGMIRNEVKDLPFIKIVAGCDILPERAQMLSEAHGAKAYTDFRKFLKDPNIEMVVISTRSLDHGPMTIQALKAGKDVLVEKPMARSVKEADRMIQTASKMNRTLLVRHNRRFDAPFLQAREIIASGKLGNIFLVRLRQHGYQRRADWQTLMDYAGGQLFNWGPHLIDWGMRLLNSPVQSMWSDLKLVAATGDAEDHLKIVLKGENQMVVDIEISGGCAIPQPQWQINGTCGTLIMHEGKGHIRYMDPTALATMQASADTPPIDGSFGNPEVIKWVEERFDVAPKVQPQFWDEIYKAMKLGQRFPVSLQEARENLRIIDLARKGTVFAKKDRSSTSRAASVTAAGT